MSFFPEDDEERERCIEIYENSQMGLDANGVPFELDDDDYYEEDDDYDY
jgi:hypothetical protein